MGKLKDIIYDLQQLEYYTGLHAGKWEENAYIRLDSTLEWNYMVENMAKAYNVPFNNNDVDFDDEYSIDEFTFELKEQIADKLKRILTNNE